MCRIVNKIIISSLAIIAAFSLVPISSIVLSNSITYANAQQTPDDNGVMMYNYHGIQRKVYNPVIVTGAGLNYYNEYTRTGSKEAKENLINTAEWLVKNAKDMGKYSLWPYEFPWRWYGWIAPPYYSALAQAQGIDALILAHRVTNNTTYLESAKKAFNSFFVDYDDGGVVTKEGEKMIFFQILARPDFGKTYVLNGHLNSLLMVWEYYKYTGEPQAKELFGEGINYLKNNLYKFDNGTWSYYDLMGNIAGANYHRAHILLLGKLYDITHEKILKDYQERFIKDEIYASVR